MAPARLLKQLRTVRNEDKNLSAAQEEAQVEVEVAGVVEDVAAAEATLLRRRIQCLVLIPRPKIPKIMDIGLHKAITGLNRMEIGSTTWAPP